MAIKRGMKRLLIAVLVIGVALLALRSYRALGGPALQPWHTFVPAELHAGDLDRSDWARYIAQEGAIFESVRTEVSQKLDPGERAPINRYFEQSPVYPAHFAQDWNRSYVMEPDGKPTGVVVLLHGLTDSPYSLRHIAKLYRDRGYVAIGVRLPGHGTVPAGLTDVRWEDWVAATRLAIREARRRVPAPEPLHLVGFSNGGALAMKYALDVIEDPLLPRADRSVFSRMVDRNHNPATTSPIAAAVANSCTRLRKASRRGASAFKRSCSSCGSLIFVVASKSRYLCPALIALALELASGFVSSKNAACRRDSSSRHLFSDPVASAVRTDSGIKLSSLAASLNRHCCMNCVARSHRETTSFVNLS